MFSGGVTCDVWRDGPRSDVMKMMDDGNDEPLSDRFDSAMIKPVAPTHVMFLARRELSGSSLLQ